MFQWDHEAFPTKSFPKLSAIQVAQPQGVCLSSMNFSGSRPTQVQHGIDADGAQASLHSTRHRNGELSKMNAAPTNRRRI
jgi:hypothetical protein